MSNMVERLEFYLPDQQARARAAARGHRAVAQTIFYLSDGSVLKESVPVRCARALRQDAPIVPSTLSGVKQSIDTVIQRECLKEVADMIARRDYSTAELTRKLSRLGYESGFVSQALERAQELHVLDERRYISSFVHERQLRGWGRRKIEGELIKRGVQVSDYVSILDDLLDRDDELTRARAVLARKSVPQNRAQDRLLRFLVGRGFSFDVALRVVKERLRDDIE